MILRYIYNTPLAQASYLVGCAATGEALVVDPNRDVEQYIDLAEREGVRVTAVTETHIHADFVSGARELAARTGARLYLSDEGTHDWKYAFAEQMGATLLRDGDTFMVGNIQIEALATPGHTPEHLSFLLSDTAAAAEPMGIFTGDFVFVGDVGRPDLLERAAGLSGTMEAGARRLHNSLQAFKTLPDYLQVWPGHGAGSACGKALGAVPQSTVGYEKRVNWGLRIEDEAQFVSEVLAGQPEPPTYFAQMKRLNKLGAPFVGDLPQPQRLALADLESALAHGMTVVDTRSAESFAAGHVPGVLNIPSGTAFLTWVGWLVSYDRPFGLIVDDAGVADVVAQLRLIGLDDLQGYWTPDVLNAWREQHGTSEVVPLLGVAELSDMRSSRDVTVIDVRGAMEYAAGNLPGSVNIPAGHLARRRAEIPADHPVVVQCQAGLRSAIAASVLLALGFDNVYDLRGGLDAWLAAGHTLESSQALEALLAT
jgi:hydroxyacylglutathione hydrolase